MPSCPALLASGTEVILGHFRPHRHLPSFPGHASFPLVVVAALAFLLPFFLFCLALLILLRIYPLFLTSHELYPSCCLFCFFRLALICRGFTLLSLASLFTHPLSAHSRPRCPLPTAALPFPSYSLASPRSIPTPLATPLARPCWRSCFHIG